MVESTAVLLACVDCRGPFARRSFKGPVPQRCPECAAHRKVAQEAAWYEAKAGVRPTSPTRCETCTIEVEFGRMGPVPRWCRPCAKTRQRAQVSEWLADRPDVQAAKWKAHKQRRRARKLGVEVERFHPMAVYLRDRWVCGICRTRVDPTLRYPDRWSPSLDHVIPLSRGGGHTRANTQLAHLKCNVDKCDAIL